MADELSVPAAGGQGAGAEQPATITDPTAGAGTEAAAKPYYAEFKKPELRGYAEKKGWADAEMLAESYMNLEKFHGVPPERLIKLPENMSDPAALKPVLERLGFAPPKEASEYGFADMEGADKEFAGVAAGWMHEIGVPVQIAKPLAEKWNAHMQAQQQALMQEVNDAVALEMGQLRGEWGGKYDANVEAARRAVRSFGFTEAELTEMESSIGAGAMYRRFLAIGQQLGESEFVGGDQQKSFSTSPETAKAEHTKLMSDKEFMAKYLSGDVAARERMSKLNKIIAGGA